jgi:hypothetical protein
VQLAQRRGVEGAGLHPGDAEAAQARAHLPRRTGREGQGEDTLGLLGAGVDRVGDAVRDGAGLARAGTGEDAERTGRGDGDLALLGVEAGEDLVGRADRPTGRRRLCRLCGVQERSPFERWSAAARTSAAWSGT